MKRKLGINTATGIINIVIGSIALLGFCFVVGASFDMAANLDPSYMNEADVMEYMSSGTILMFTFGWLLSVISVIMSIISMVMSKKNGISMAGPIVACVGSALNLLTINVLAIINGPLMIIGGIIGLLQKNVASFDYDEEPMPGQVQMPRQAPMQGQQAASQDMNTLNMNKQDEAKSVEFKEVNNVGSEDEWKL